MRIGIVPSVKTSHTIRRLTDVGKARGHDVRIIHPGTVSILLQSEKSDLFVKNTRPRQIDAIIPRLESGASQLMLAVVRQFEQLGTFSINTSSAITVAHDKLRTGQVLARNMLPIPDSSWVLHQSEVPKAIEKLGGAPIVIKTISGSQGKGVLLAESDKVAKAMIEALQIAGHAVILQKFIKESAGQDIRAFVVGDQVVASMRRIAAGDDFRSNLHKGGTAEAVELDEHTKNVAVRAAHAVGLRVAGVDLIESNDGPLVIEVNASPGLQGIEAATGIDVASAIYSHLEEEINFPDFDFKEQMSLGRGYSVLQISINEASPYRDRTLAEIQFEDKGIQLLRIARGKLTIPFPHDEELLRLGDILLLFGKRLDLMTLRQETPAQITGT